MDHLKHLDSLSECHLCVTPFEISVDAPLRLPTRGKHCSHRICQCCILKFHIQVENKRRYLDCPACLSPKSFHAKRPKVDDDLCQALTAAPKKLRQELITVHQQPWKLPLGIYSVLLERVGNWYGDESTKSHMTMSTMHGIVQGLLQVHNF